MANPEPFFVSDPLLRQAEKICKERLATDPDNPSHLGSLANVYRKQGRLEDAAALYERLTRLDPADQQAAYMLAVLVGAGLPPRPAGIQPAPFVLLKNFLPSSFHGTLLPFALATQDKLTKATVGKDEYRPETRESLELRGNNDAQKRFEEYVRQALPAVVSRLDAAPFEIGKLEVKLRTYLDGHFFRIHMDNPPKSPDSCNRQVSYVYFYHRVPRAYVGGELLLFDTDLEHNQLTTSCFTRIVPDDNSVVFFLSGCYHSVVPVSVPSKAFEDSRFVINGHVSKAAMAKPVAAEAPEAGATVAS